MFCNGREKNGKRDDNFGRFEPLDMEKYHGRIRARVESELDEFVASLPA